jgi:hypothetical protein
MPQFMMIICNDMQQRDQIPPDEFGKQLQKVGEWWQANEKAGHLVAGVGNRLQDAHTARTVRINNGSTAVTDGPFVETKETIGGFGLINAPDINAAVEIAKGWPAQSVTIEVRPVLEM